jgi:flavin-dependent dehydrogenase
VALEALVPVSACRRSHPLRFDFGVIGKGYGWLFPKRDHINVGLYTRRPDQFKLSRQALVDYASAQLGTDSLQQVCGYPIATGGEYYRPTSPRVLLVGDAAGMAEPLLGEGIHNAIHSGQIAASAVIAALREGSSALDEFRRGLQGVQRDLYLTRQVARAFYPALPLTYAALVRYPVRQVLLNGFAAGLTMHQCLQAFPRFQTTFSRRSSATLADLSAD